METKYLKVTLKWMILSVKNRGVTMTDDNSFNFRIEKAKEQLELAKKIKFDEQKMIDLVNEFLEALGMEKISDPKIYLKNTLTRRIDYSRMRKKYHHEKDDIVWIKLSNVEDSKVISVIGTSEDIYFSDRAKNETASGKINKCLGLEWEESYVFIFPLVNIPEGLYRSDIESGIGNYLVDASFPILDYYSHNY